MRFIASLLCLILLTACGAKPEAVFHAEGNPKTLSEWGQVTAAGGKLVLSEGVTPYDLNTPLFTDYAQKLRTVWIEGDEAADFSANGPLDFPVGTVITKTFYYAQGVVDGEVIKDKYINLSDRELPLSGVKLIETRILVRRKDKWDALPYVWNDEQTDAFLKRTGDMKPLTLVDGGAKTDFAYLVPNTNQCAGCHAINNTTRELQPIGPKARHLDRDFSYAGGAENQLKAWSELRLLKNAAPTKANAVWNDPAAPLNDRARSYLDINCSHCHSETGPALTSGLHLTPDTPMGPHLGLCKLPIAAGRGTGGRRLSIVPGNPDASILPYRMDSTALDIMMPEVGRSLIHAEGVALIREWIEGLDGSCE